MRTQLFKFILFAACAGLFVVVCGRQTDAQTPKHVRFTDVFSKLTSASRTGTPVREVNVDLISSVRRQKVSFILDADDETTLRKAGGSDSLIKAIRKNTAENINAILKTQEEQRVLYKKFTDNYNGNIEQKKLAVEAAKEFVRKYADDADNEEDIVEVIRYFREAIPHFEKDIARAGL